MYCFLKETMNYEDAKAIVSEWLQREPVPGLIVRRNPSSDIELKGSVSASITVVHQANLTICI